MRDLYAAKKAEDAKFSFRYFARRAGFTSSNFLKLVMDGDRNLGPTAIARVASAMKLTDEEADFFGLLVAMNQAQTVADRNRAFERVAANRRFRAARKLDGPLFEYLTRWYYPVIRELAGRDDFVEDAAWIGSQVYPPVEPKDVRAALKTLENLGLLVRDETGKLARGDASVTTGHEVRHVVVPAYHLQMIERAAKAVEIVPVDQRDVSSLTVCIREATLSDLKAKIHRFREEMLDRCDSDSEPERVFQLCIQLFPLSKSKAIPQKTKPRAAAPTGRSKSIAPARIAPARIEAAAEGATSTRKRS